jgi:hypothetical protein
VPGCGGDGADALRKCVEVAAGGRDGDGRHGMGFREKVRNGLPVLYPKRSTFEM